MCPAPVDLDDRAQSSARSLVALLGGGITWGSIQSSGDYPALKMLAETADSLEWAGSLEGAVRRRDLHPAFNRFERTLRGRPLATDDFRAGAYAQPKKRAVALAEIAPDPDGWVRAVRVEVDHADAGASWLDAGLPQPTFIIVRPDGPHAGHAHLIWELRAWVRCDRPNAVRYLEAVRNAYTAALGGDPAYAGTFQHNPLAPCWRVIAGPAEPYTLGDLAQHVELFTPRPHTSRRLDEIAQYGRNCGAFARAARRAYTIVDMYRQRDDRAGFDQRVVAAVLDENAAFANPLPASEIRSIAKSIAGWTWTVYRRGNGAAQAHGTASERTRAEYLAGAAAARAQAVRLRSEGLGASEIGRRMNRSRSWVYLALNSVAKASVQSPGPSGFAREGGQVRDLGQATAESTPVRGLGQATGIVRVLQQCGELATEQLDRHQDDDLLAYLAQRIPLADPPPPGGPDLESPTDLEPARRVSPLAAREPAAERSRSGQRGLERVAAVFKRRRPVRVSGGPLEADELLRSVAARRAVIRSVPADPVARGP